MVVRGRVKVVGRVNSSVLHLWATAAAGSRFVARCDFAGHATNRSTVLTLRAPVGRRTVQVRAAQDLARPSRVKSHGREEAQGRYVVWSGR